MAHTVLDRNTELFMLSNDQIWYAYVPLLDEKRECPGHDCTYSMHCFNARRKAQTRFLQQREDLGILVVCKSLDRSDIEEELYTVWGKQHEEEWSVRRRWR